MHIIWLIGGEHPERFCKCADVFEWRAESDEEVRMGTTRACNLQCRNAQSYFLLEDMKEDRNTLGPTVSLTGPNCVAH